MANQNEYVLKITADINDLIKKFSEGKIGVDKFSNDMQLLQKKIDDALKTAGQNTKKNIKEIQDNITNMKINTLGDNFQKEELRIKQSYANNIKQTKEYYNQLLALTKDGEERRRIASEFKQTQSQMKGQMSKDVLNIGKEQRQGAIKNIMSSLPMVGGSIGQMAQLTTPIGAAMVGVDLLKQGVTAIQETISEGLQKAREYETALTSIFATTGIRKGSAEARDLEEGIKKLSITMGDSAINVAKFSNDLLYLGVSKDNLVPVSNNIYKLSESLTEFNGKQSEVSQTIMALSNSFKGESGDLVDYTQRIGSSLVTVAADSATTADSIMQASIRMSNAAGSGFKSYETFALGATALSAGLQAEVAGTGINMMLTKVGESKKELASFLKMTEKQYEDLRNKNPMDLLIQTLEKLKKETNIAKKQDFISEVFGAESAKVVNKLEGDLDGLKRRLTEAKQGFEGGTAQEELFKVKTGTGAFRKRQKEAETEQLKIEMATEVGNINKYISQIKLDVLRGAVKLFRNDTDDFISAVGDIDKAMQSLDSSKATGKSIEDLSNKYIETTQRLQNLNPASEEYQNTLRMEKKLLDDIAAINPTLALSYDQVKGSVDELNKVKDKYLLGNQQEQKMLGQGLEYQVTDALNKYNQAMVEGNKISDQVQIKMAGYSSIMNQSKEDTQEWKDAYAGSIRASEEGTEAYSKIMQTRQTYHTLLEKEKIINKDNIDGHNRFMEAQKNGMVIQKQLTEQRIKDLQEQKRQVLSNENDTIGRADIGLDRLLGANDVGSVRNFATEAGINIGNDLVKSINEQIANSELEMTNIDNAMQAQQAAKESQVQLTDDLVSGSSTLLGIEDELNLVAQMRGVSENDIIGFKSQQIGLAQAHLNAEIASLKVIQQQIQMVQSLLGSSSAIANMAQQVTNDLAQKEVQKFNLQLAEIGLQSGDKKPKSPVSPKTPDTSNLPKGGGGGGKSQADKAEEKKKKEEEKEAKELAKEQKDALKKEEKSREKQEKDDERLFEKQSQDMEKRLEAEQKEKERLIDVSLKHFDKMEELQTESNNLILDEMTKAVNSIEDELNKNLAQAKTPQERQFAFEEYAQKLSNLVNKEIFKIEESLKILRNSNADLLSVTLSDNQATKEKIDLINKMGDVLTKSLALQKSMSEKELKNYEKKYNALQQLEKYAKTSNADISTGGGGKYGESKSSLDKSLNKTQFISDTGDIESDFESRLAATIKSWQGVLQAWNNVKDSPERTINDTADFIKQATQDLQNLFNARGKAEKNFGKDSKEVSAIDANIKHINKVLSDTYKDVILKQPKLYSGFVETLNEDIQEKLKAGKTLTSMDFSDVIKDQSPIDWESIRDLIAEQLGKNKELKGFVGNVITKYFDYKGLNFTQKDIAGMNPTKMSEQLLDAYRYLYRKIATIQDKTYKAIKASGFSDEDAMTLSEKAAKLELTSQDFHKLLMKEGKRFTVDTIEAEGLIKELNMAKASMSSIDKIIKDGKQMYINLSVYLQKVSADLDRIIITGLENIKKKYGVQKILSEKDLKDKITDYSMSYADDFSKMNKQLHDERITNENKYWQLRKELSKQAFETEKNEKFFLMNEYMKQLQTSAVDFIVKTAKGANQSSFLELVKIKNLLPGEFSEAFRIPTKMVEGKEKFVSTKEWSSADVGADGDIGQGVKKTLISLESKVEGFNELKKQNKKYNEEEAGAAKKALESFKEQLYLASYISNIQKKTNDILTDRYRLKELYELKSSGVELNKDEMQEIEDLEKKKTNFKPEIQGMSRDLKHLMASLKYSSKDIKKNGESLFQELKEAVKDENFEVDVDFQPNLLELNEAELKERLDRANQLTKEVNNSFINEQGNALSKFVKGISDKYDELNVLGLKEMESATIRTGQKLKAKGGNKFENNLVVDEGLNILNEQKKAEMSGDMEMADAWGRKWDEFSIKHKDIADEMKDDYTDLTGKAESMQRAMMFSGIVGGISNLGNEVASTATEIKNAENETDKLKSGLTAVGKVGGAIGGEVGAIVQGASQLAQTGIAIYEAFDTSRSDAEAAHIKQMQTDENYHKFEMFALQQKEKAVEDEKTVQQDINDLIQIRLGLYEALLEFNKYNITALKAQADTYENSINTAVDKIIKNYGRLAKSGYDISLLKPWMSQLEGLTDFSGNNFKEWSNNFQSILTQATASLGEFDQGQYDALKTDTDAMLRSLDAMKGSSGGAAEAIDYFIALAQSPTTTAEEMQSGLDALNANISANWDQIKNEDSQGVADIMYKLNEIIPKVIAGRKELMNMEELKSISEGLKAITGDAKAFKEVMTSIVKEYMDKMDLMESLGFTKTDEDKLKAIRDALGGYLESVYDIKMDISDLTEEQVTALMEQVNYDETVKDLLLEQYNILKAQNEEMDSINDKVFKQIAHWEAIGAINEKQALMMKIQRLDTLLQNPDLKPSDRTHYEEVKGNLMKQLLGDTGFSASTGGVGVNLGSYATGTDYVPQTGSYLLHEGEAVLTKEMVKYYKGLGLQLEGNAISTKTNKININFGGINFNGIPAKQQTEFLRFIKSPKVVNAINEGLNNRAY